MSDSEDDSFGNFSENEASGRLKNLFGSDSAPQLQRRDSNPLKYVPPKKSSVTLKNGAPTNQSGDKQQPIVIHATAVQLFQYNATTQKFDPVGKAGCAILSQAGSQFQVLCYRSSKDYICVTNITPSFTYTIQNSQYGSFYDSNSQLWSLLFQTSDDALHFSTYIAIAKYYANNRKAISIVNLNEQAQDDLNSGTDVVKNGTTVAVKYTGWLLDEYKLGKAFDSNASSDKAFTFKVGEHAVIRGWEEGLLGMKSGGKRFIVIPPNLGYGDSAVSQIPANSTLCFQVEVQRLKQTKKNPVTSQQPQQSVVEEGSADVKKRMAKLGMQSPFGDFQVSPRKEVEVLHQNSPQPILPSQIVQQPVQHYAVGQQQTQQVAQPIQQVVQQPIQQPYVQQPVQQSQIVQPVQQPQQILQQPVYQQPVQQQAPQIRTSSPANFVSESGTTSETAVLRQQIAALQQMLASLNTTSAMVTTPSATTPVQFATTSPIPTEPVQQPVQQPTVTKPSSLEDIEQRLTQKIEQIATKIDNIDLYKVLSSTLKDDGKMSGPLLLQNVQHLLSVNAQLETDLTQEREKVDSLIEKVSTLRKRNERYAQESYQADQERENDHLSKQLDDAKKQIAEFKRKVGRLNESVENEKDHSAQLQTEIDNLTKQLRSAKKQFEDAKTEWKEHEQMIRNEAQETLRARELELQKERELALKSQESTIRTEAMLLLQTSTGELKHQHEVEIAQLRAVLEAEVERLKRDNQSRASQLTQGSQERLDQLSQAHTEQLEKIAHQHRLQLDQLTLTHQQQMQSRIDQITHQHRELLEQTRRDFDVRLRESLEQQAVKLEQEFEQRLQEELEEQQEKLRQAFRDRLAQYQEQQQEEKEQLVQELVKTVMSKVYGRFQIAIANKNARYRGGKIIRELAAIIKKVTNSLIAHIEAGKELDEFGAQVEEGEEEEEEEEQNELSDDEDPVVLDAPVVPKVPVLVPKDDDEEEEEDLSFGLPKSSPRKDLISPRKVKSSPRNMKMSSVEPNSITQLPSTETVEQVDTQESNESESNKSEPKEEEETQQEIHQADVPQVEQQNEQVEILDDKQQVSQPITEDEKVKQMSTEEEQTEQQKEEEQVQVDEHVDVEARTAETQNHVQEPNVTTETENSVDIPTSPVREEQQEQQILSNTDVCEEPALEALSNGIQEENITKESTQEKVQLFVETSSKVNDQENKSDEVQENKDFVLGNQVAEQTIVDVQETTEKPVTPKKNFNLDDLDLDLEKIEKLQAAKKKSVTKLFQDDNFFDF
jgi:hypothetical protein